MNDRMEMLVREVERWQIVVELQGKIANCDEDERGCDVCVGLRYAINTIKDRMESK